MSSGPGTVSRQTAVARSTGTLSSSAPKTTSVGTRIARRSGTGSYWDSARASAHRSGAGELDAEAVRTVREADLVAVSAVSAWEIALKRALGKLRFDDRVEDVTADYGFTTLPVTLRHGDRLRDLPFHHPDRSTGS